MSSSQKEFNCTAFCNAYCLMYQIITGQVAGVILPETVIATQAATYINSPCFSRCYYICTNLTPGASYPPIPISPLPDVGVRFVRDLVDLVDPTDINGLRDALRRFIKTNGPDLRSAGRYIALNANKVRIP